MNILGLLYKSLMAKLSPLKTRLFKWLNPAYLLAFVNRGVRQFFVRIFNIRPRDENDYYPVGAWLISKRLAIALLVIMTVLSLVYLRTVMPDFSHKSNLRAFRYDSVLLKYIKNSSVAILGKSGYLAYEGEVKNGICDGNGRLYDKDGNVVYAGEFARNMYNGRGKRYYPGGPVWYDGEFVDNVFNGKGRLNRPDATLEYNGDFLNGMKEGEGILYDASGNPVFSGVFVHDEILYKQLLSKTTEELNEVYLGKLSMTLYDGGFLSAMRPIDAICTGESGDDTLEGKAVINGVYVLKDQILVSGNSVGNARSLLETFGGLSYQGNTDLTVTDAFAASISDHASEALKRSIEIDSNDVLKDASTITGFSAALPVYVYVYSHEDCTYTFFTEREGGDFFMYLIQGTA